MNKEKYYIIEISEDGDISVTENSAEDIKKLINTDKEAWDAEIVSDTCNDEMPASGDPNYWGDKRILIIKGKIVTPKPITKQYKIE